MHGPPGTGKTLMAKAVANEVDASFHSIGGPEIMSRFYGESEERLREIFEEAEQEAPAIIFIDEIDALAPSREESGGDVEQRIVAQLLSLMDGLEERGDVVVIGATNRVDDIDSALRRGGRFDRELEIGVPDKEGRKEIFQIHTRNMPLEDTIDLDEYAEKTYGFVGSDIHSMTKEAAMSTLRRVRPELDLSSGEVSAGVLMDIEVLEEDFNQAMKDTTPSAMREVFVEVPDVEWDDVGGLSDTKQQLVETVQWPLDHANVFDKMKMKPTKGVLMYGPPGTGKTMLAKAVANESDSNFISVKGPELLDKYIGESEKGVRQIFEKARENAPTVVFFDEIDAIATQRGANSGGSGVTERVVSQLLTELDGLQNLDDVVVVATSNRPDLIDDALLRPGRLSKQVHVPVPDENSRESVFQVHTEGKPLSDDVNFNKLAIETEGFVGADIEEVCREASMNASRNAITDAGSGAVGEHQLEELEISMEDFETAVEEATASVTVDIREQYNEIEKNMERSKTEQTQSIEPRTFQ
jgi:transitional endoplasmic reticulum ATPase